MNDFSSLYMDTIPRAMGLLRSEMRKEAAPYLTVPQFRILAHVNKGTDSVNALALRHGVSQPAMSKMVESMVAKGLVERRSDSQDRRCYVLTLSPQGKTLFNKIKKRAYKGLGAAATRSGVDLKELIQALGTLKTFVERLDELE